MEARNVPKAARPIAAIFLCTLCDKPFTRETQYKRHLAYCRKVQGRIRPRSCSACNQAKIKCNYRAPCHQCTRKGMNCVYGHPQQRKGTGEAGSQIIRTTPISTSSTLIGSESTQSELGDEPLGEGFHVDLEQDGLLDPFDQIQVIDFDSEIIPSISQHSLNGRGAENRRMSGTFGGYPSEATVTPTSMTTSTEVDSFMSLLNDTLGNNTGYDTNFQMDSYDYDNSKEFQKSTISHAIPPIATINQSPYPSLPSPSIIGLTRTISPSLDIVLSGQLTKIITQTQAQQGYATMMIDMIRAFPRMMIRRETFPPFIHAYSPAGDINSDQKKLPVHLTNCMGITQLYAVCNEDTRSFLWATIRAETRQMKSEMRTFTKYDALSALQASLLYLIMHAVNNKRQDAKHNHEMIMTHVTLCGRALDFSLCFQEEETKSDTAWKDWIIFESLNRLALVWYILCCVFQIRTGSRCYVCEAFRDLPLPCSKAMWEAKTESQWRSECNAEAMAKNAGGGTLRTFGDLVDAQQSQLEGRKSDKLDFWNAGIDLLGMLLNMAVYMT